MFMDAIIGFCRRGFHNLSGNGYGGDPPGNAQTCPKFLRAAIASSLSLFVREMQSTSKSPRKEVMTA
jgi:hypothetical protein